MDRGRKIKDITGQRFGKLVAVECVGRKNGETLWKCKCDCGNYRVVSRSCLVRGKMKSCGCFSGKKKDLTGQRFGKLVAIKQVEKDKFGNCCWECKCDCGNTVKVITTDLVNNHKFNCGCEPFSEVKCGQRYGKLVVLEYAGRNKNGEKLWKCQCNCGNIKIVRSYSLKTNRIKSCGCISNYKDVTGQRFGKLVAIEPTDNRKFSEIVWKCECDCGNIVYLPLTDLKRAKSCGCIFDNRTKDRLYMVWINMKNRCSNHNDKSYKNYGSRGIKVCDEWENNYLAFKSWAYQNGYDENAKKGDCTIDRIDVNGNYEPSNCRWVGMKTQSNNKRNTIMLEYGNKKLSLSEWAEILNISYHLLWGRYNAGFSVEEILGFKKHIKHNNIEIKAKSLKEWSQVLGISYSTLYSRYKKGLPPEEIFKGAKIP